MGKNASLYGFPKLEETEKGFSICARIGAIPFLTWKILPYIEQIPSPTSYAILISEAGQSIPIKVLHANNGNHQTGKSHPDRDSN